MPAEPILPLEAIGELEGEINWDHPAAKSISTFINLLTEVLGVNATKLASISGVVVSGTQPDASDNNKIWAKTSEPTGVGVYSGGWQISYKWPQNTPMLWDTQQEKVPAFMEELQTSEISGAGLTAPTDDRWVWVIFRPKSFQ